MTTWEYTYIWWTASVTSDTNGRLGETTPPIGDEIPDKLNTLGADGWEIDHITTAPLTTAPLTTGWVNPRGGTAAAGFTDRVHCLALLRRLVGTST